MFISLIRNSLCRNQNLVKSNCIYIADCVVSSGTLHNYIKYSSIQLNHRYRGNETQSCRYSINKVSAECNCIIVQIAEWKLLQISCSVLQVLKDKVYYPGLGLRWRMWNQLSYIFKITFFFGIEFYQEHEKYLKSFFSIKVKIYFLLFLKFVYLRLVKRG